jgi:hypothetical protein
MTGKRMGRPTKKPEPGTRVSLGLKVTPEIKHKIDEAARASGRTQSQEAELRLERAFEHDRLLPDVLETAFGRQLAGVLLMLGTAMKQAGEISTIASFGFGMQNWFDVSYAFDQAARSANQILQALRPAGDLVAPQYSFAENCGAGSANAILEEAASGKSRLMTPEDQDRAARMHKMIGTLADRIKQYDLLSEEPK